MNASLAPSSTSRDPLAGFVYRFEPGRPEAGSGAALPPALLLLHGTGGDENSLLALGRSLAPDAALLSPRGQVLEHGTTPRFFRRLAEGVFDVPDLIARTEGLAGFVRAAAERHPFDARRVYALGYSNGANIAASLLLLHPGTLAGAALLRPMVPLEPSELPSLAGAPVWIASGRRDEIISQDEPEQLAAMLRQAGAAVTLRWHDHAGHGLTQAELVAAGEWLREAMK